MLRFVSFSARTIAIAYVAVSLAVLAIFAGPLWYAWDVNIGQVRTDLLRADARRLQKLYNRHGVAALAAGIEAQVGGIEEGVGRLMLLVDPAGHRLAGNLRAWPGGVPACADDAQAATIHVSGQSRRVELVNVPLAGGYRLLIASNLNRFVKLESLFIYGLLGCATVVLIVGVVGGLMIRRTLLSRVDSISVTTAAIVEGQLSKRLPAPQSGDELEMLTHTVNGMLDQIQKLVHGVQDVSNAIAHDLRTPLSELRARLEELSVNRPGRAETFAEIDAAIADVDLVMAIFNALLRLADIDSGTRRGGFVVVDLAEMASEVAEFYLPVAEMKGIALSLETDADLQMSGDPLLLAQALSNLVENALKYAPDNGSIAIRALHTASGVGVTVADNGPGIPDAEKPKVTDRFYRGDASRGTPGVGLGLSLVSAVARLHGGTLELADNLPGLRATLHLGPAMAVIPQAAAAAKAATTTAQG